MRKTIVWKHKYLFLFHLSHFFFKGENENLVGLMGELMELNTVQS